MKGPREYKRLKTRSIELARQPSMNFFELAVLLAELADGPYVGLVEDLPNETGMSRRRLYYLLAAGRLIVLRSFGKFYGIVIPSLKIHKVIIKFSLRQLREREKSE